MQIQEVEGVATCAPRLEVVKKRLRRDVGVKLLRISKFLHPCILNDGEYRLRSLLLHHLVGAAVGALGFVRRFRARVENRRGIIVNCRVVGANLCGFDEFLTIARCVHCHKLNEANEVVYASCFVVRDLKEEGRHNIPDLREVSVGRMAVYRLELFGCIGEYCHSLFG